MDTHKLSNAPLQEVKLGKLEVKHDDRNLRLANYTAKLPDPPESLGLVKDKWTGYGVLGNGDYGDCTCAALGHMTQIWTGKTPTDKDVLNLYAKVNGGVDEGANMLDVLNHFHKQGWSHVREKAFAFVQLDPHNWRELGLAVELFGGVYLGLALPLSAKSQTGTPDSGALWDVAPSNNAQGSWGGHAVNVVNYSPGRLSIITWGFVQNMTQAFLNEYADEAYAVLPTSWEKKPPTGFDFVALENDLKEVTA